MVKPIILVITCSVGRLHACMHVQRSRARFARAHVDYNIYCMHTRAGAIACKNISVHVRYGELQKGKALFLCRALDGFNIV